MKTGLVIIIVAYLALSTAYSLAVPFGQPPDEGAHAEYVRVLAETGSLPRLDVTRTGAEDPRGYEAHQPPLYYAAAAPAWLLAKALGAGETGAVRSARAISTLFGAAGIVLIAWLALLALGTDRPWLALAAAGFAAFLPTRLHVHASVSNDALTEATATLVLCLLLLGLRQGFDRRRALWLGLALGAALLAKASNLLLLPVAVLAIVLSSSRQTDGAQPTKRPGRAPSEAARGTFDTRAFLMAAGIAFGTAALIAGWWFVRNQMLYGEPLLERTFREKFRNAPATATMVIEFGYRDFHSYLLGQVLPTTFQTFWGGFRHLGGQADFLGVLLPGTMTQPELIRPLIGLPARGSYPPPSWLYPILALCSWLAFAGAVRWYLRARESFGAEQRNVALLLGVFTLLVGAAFLRFNTEYFQAQGRYLYPALGPLSIAFVGGSLSWLPEARRRVGVAVLLLVMVALALFAYLTVLSLEGPGL